MPMSDTEYRLRHLGDDILPPFVLEVFMKNGERYYVHSSGMPSGDEEQDNLTLRIWDLRAFGPTDLVELQAALNRPEFSRADLVEETKVHPKLDWGILRARMSNVEYCVEWHDRYWPGDEPKRPLGFK